MACLEVKDLPERTLSFLKTRAKANSRTLNGEILFIFDWVEDHGIADTPPAKNAAVDSFVLRQKSRMEELIGSWKDERNADEIISDIRKARTPGREVKL
jgi:hypothetical protein